MVVNRMGSQKNAGVAVGHCLLAFIAALIALARPALATTGPGCLVVVNVEAGDVLNLRAKPSANSNILSTLVPHRHGVIHLDAKCTPQNLPWSSRWCPVTVYDGSKISKGWVKARFVRDSECP